MTLTLPIVSPRVSAFSFSGVSGRVLFSASVFTSPSGSLSVLSSASARVLYKVSSSEPAKAETKFDTLRNVRVKALVDTLTEKVPKGKTKTSLDTK